MTFQPPPPPPPPAPPPGPAGQPHGAPPPPPPSGAQPGGAQPPGAWGPPPGSPYRASAPAFDPKTVNPLDWAILGAGLLTFVFSFVSYYTFSALGVSVSENAWHGFFGWFAMLCALAGSVLVALEIFAPTVRMPFAARLTGLGLYAVATICVILALFLVPGYLGYDVPSGVDKGHGVGYWISLIVIIAGLVLSLMRFQQGGGKLPGALSSLPNIGGYAPGAPGGAHHPGAPQNPPPGYPPPPGPPAP